MTNAIWFPLLGLEKKALELIDASQVMHVRLRDCAVELGAYIQSSHVIVSSARQ